MITTRDSSGDGAGARVRAVAAAVGAALLVLVAPAAAQAGASAERRDLVRAREVAARSASASAATVAAALPVSAAERRAGLRALASRTRPARVVIGLRSPGDVADMAELARSYGGRVQPLPDLAAVALTADSPARLAAELGGRRDVAYLEPAVRRKWTSHDPSFDHSHGPGLPFAWGFGLGPGFVGVNAQPAIDAAGGRSAFTVAVLDSGIDEDHPALRPNLTAYHNALRFDPEGNDDNVGHGTFVAGLASARGGSRGLRGTAGDTPLIAVKVGNVSGPDADAIAGGINWASRNGARVINLSLGGPELSRTERRAIVNAFNRDVLVVAAAGNDGDGMNLLEYPAAMVGGDRGRTGIGLSVAATRPDGSHAQFSSHNDAVSVSAPGASASPADCRHGVWSTLPGNRTLFWDPASPEDPPPPCSNVEGSIGDPGRYGYSEGTSMSSPLTAGLASVVWMANRDMAADQVADVINRSARQTRPGPDWNEFTGHGVVDGGAAIAMAATYDTAPPSAVMRARRTGRRRDRVRVFATGTDVADPGDAPAGAVDVAFYTSIDGRNFARYAGPRPGRLTRKIRLPKRRRLWIQAAVCDANVNCTVKQRGPFKPRRRRR